MDINITAEIKLNKINSDGLVLNSFSFFVLQAIWLKVEILLEITWFHS